MIEKLFSSIPNSSEFIGIAILFGILLIISIIKKIQKLAILILAGLILYSAYLYF
tara:strand:+ start:871 stop:1035 length:165 start_codon:yes stop_codon:yes gene_type:complete